MNPKVFQENVIEYIKSFGFTEDTASIIKSVLGTLLIIIIEFIIYFIAKKILLHFIKKIILKSKNKYDDIFLKNHVFDSLSFIIPAIIIYEIIPYTLHESYTDLIKPAIIIFLIIIILKVINSALNSLHEVFLHLPVSKNSDIKSYIQVVKIIIMIVGIVFIFSILFNKSPVTLLTSLGAVTAVLLLVFKDTILGLVAGIQLSANKMLKTGDWISVPSKDADGPVIEITLHTVKVQNFDNTITTIPTYSLVNDSFTNWKGMEDSGGRRIKRSIIIDINTVKFCNDKMLNKFEKIELLNEYIIEGRKKINEYNNKKEGDNIPAPNLKRLTNIGTFRIYIQKFLESKFYDLEKNPNGNFLKEMTLLVRQLQSTEKGLPIEIYVFASTTAWAEYEKVQADLFDHLFAIIPEFELKIFQNPTGNDFASKF